MNYTLKLITDRELVVMDHEGNIGILTNDCHWVSCDKKKEWVSTFQKLQWFGSHYNITIEMHEPPTLGDFVPVEVLSVL